MIANKNNNLANQEFSNITKEELFSAGGKAKGFIDASKGKPKQDTTTEEKPVVAAKPPAKSETLIFDMHPVTLIIGVVGVLLITGVSVIAYKHFNK